MAALRASASAGADGPVVALSGEADATTAAELRETLATQLDTGARQVTVDASGLSFLDSASLRVLILAARALRGAARHAGVRAAAAARGQAAGNHRRRQTARGAGVVSAAWETRRYRPSAWPRC